MPVLLCPPPTFSFSFPLQEIDDLRKWVATSIGRWGQRGLASRQPEGLATGLACCHAGLLCAAVETRAQPSFLPACFAHMQAGRCIRGIVKALHPGGPQQAHAELANHHAA